MPLKILDVKQMSKHRTEKEKQELFDSYYRTVVQGRFTLIFIVLIFGMIFVVLMVYQNPDDPSLPSWFVNFIYWLKGILN